MGVKIEDMLPGVQYNGLSTDKPGTVGHTTVAIPTTTATLTAAQVALGYIDNASGTMTLTMPTGTLLGAYLGAKRGTTMDLFVDNTGSSVGPITIAVGANGILSDAAATTAASFGQLTVAAGATGIGQFKIMFSSATAYVFTRVA
jgi:hypothetical protein